jgi:hypothetical protein
MDVAGKTVKSASELKEGVQGHGNDVSGNVDVDREVLCAHGVKEFVGGVVGKHNHEVVVALVRGTALSPTTEEIDGNRVLPFNDRLEEATEAVVSQKLGGDR